MRPLCHITLTSTDDCAPKIKLCELMRGKKRVILEHGDKPYLLSITRKGKLILTAADHPLEPAATTQDKPMSNINPDN